jgi:hypothetical protein
VGAHEVGEALKKRPSRWHASAGVNMNVEHMNVTPPSTATQTSSPLRGGVEASLGSDRDTQGQFVKLPRELLERTDLTPAAKLVYAEIRDRLGDNGEAWPGLRRIAKGCGLGRSTVDGCIDQIEAAGLLVVERPRGNPAGTTNRYRLPGSPHSVTYQKADVPKSGHRTCQKADTGRTENRTKSDSFNQTHITKHKRKVRANGDPWELAQKAMSGDALRTDAFRTAWGEWVEYRRQTGRPLTPATIVRQIRKLEEFGHDAAIESIERSIGQGWQGLFLPHADRSRNGGARARVGRNGEFPENLRL